MNTQAKVTRSTSTAQRETAGRALNARWSYRISTLASLLDRQSARRFARHDLNLVQWRILTSIEAMGPSSMGELLPLAAVDRALVSREVAALEARKLLKVAVDKKDKRRKIVSLTPAGAAKHAEVLPDVLSRHAFLDAALTQQERDVFVRAIDKLKRRILDNIESESETSE